MSQPALKQVSLYTARSKLTLEIPEARGLQIPRHEASRFRDRFLHKTQVFFLLRRKEERIVIVIIIIIISISLSISPCPALFFLYQRSLRHGIRSFERQKPPIAMEVRRLATIFSHLSPSPHPHHHPITPGNLRGADLPKFSGYFSLLTMTN